MGTDGRKKLGILTINVRGLNDRNKRLMVREYLKSFKIDLVCMQETHISGDQISCLDDLGLRRLASTSQSGKVGGVAILTTNTTLIVHRILADKLGRWVITACEIASSQFTLCTVYASNSDYPEVIDSLKLKLVSWPLPIIVCGDFNCHRQCPCTISPLAVSRKPKVMSAIDRLQENHALCDVWSVLKPLDPGYTFFSHPHS